MNKSRETYIPAMLKERQSNTRKSDKNLLLRIHQISILSRFYSLWFRRIKLDVRKVWELLHVGNSILIAESIEILKETTKM